MGQIWPEGHSLLTLGVEGHRQKIGRSGIVKPGPRRERWSRSCLWIWKGIVFRVCACVCVWLIRSYAVISIGGVRTSEVDPSKKNLWLEIKNSRPYGSLGLESVCLSQGCKGCKEQKSLLCKNIHTFTHPVTLVGMVRVPQGGWSWEPRGYCPPAPLYNPCSFAGQPS